MKNEIERQRITPQRNQLMYQEFKQFYDAGYRRLASYEKVGEKLGFSSYTIRNAVLTVERRAKKITKRNH